MWIYLQEVSSLLTLDNKQHEEVACIEHEPASLSGKDAETQCDPKIFVISDSDEDVCSELESSDESEGGELKNEKKNHCVWKYAWPAFYQL